MPYSDAQSAGLDAGRLRQARALMQRWVETNVVPAAALCVGRRRHVLEPILVGRQRPGEPAALRDDAQFLIASITKPVTATAALLLVERGQLALHDRVASIVPAFAANGKENVTVLHLLTHTSGLPDMLADNERLRREHRPLAAFVEATCRLAPAFRAGTRVNYQSMGSAMLAEIVRVVSGVPLAEFLQREVFRPLGMNDTTLGTRTADRVARIRLPAGEQARAEWGWNSGYWLAFGAPWGGLITTPADLAKLCRAMLGGGALDEARLLSPATVRAMTTNQLAGQPEVPEEDRRCKPWGLGWRLNWPGQPDSFGDLLGANAYGHWGATGTLCWIDPDADLFFILFTTEPLDTCRGALVRLSNLVAASRL